MDVSEWRRVKEFIEELDLELDLTQTHACPVCHREGKFTVTQVSGGVLYNCYSASCDTHGMVKQRMSVDCIKSALMGRQETKEELFILPKSFIPITREERAYEYFTKNFDTWDIGLPKININFNELYFDLAESRICFPIYNISNNLVGSVGRALDANKKPKWLTYGNVQYPYLAGNSSSSVGLVVEDSISALRASDCVNGYALLGTNLYDTHLQFFKECDRIIVALDKDASHKAVEIAAEINNYTPACVRIIDKDVKYMTLKELQELIR